LASDLASLAGRSDPAKAARIYGQAARLLATALEHEKDADACNRLASDLASLADRFDPAEAAQIYGQATRALADAIARDTSGQTGMGMGMMMGWRQTSPGTLTSMTARMAPDEAVRVIATALKQASNPDCRTALAQVLSATVDRLNAVEADRVCEQVIGSLDRDALDSVAPELLSQLNPGRAHALAWDLASRMCSEPESDTDVLSRILTNTSREQRARRAARMAAAAGPGLKGILEAAARVSAEPFPCRLTTQELVELLKMPTCLRGARRIVLDHLGNRYSRRFANHWDFVRFATEQKLGLDFTTPPERPDRKDTDRPRSPEKRLNHRQGYSQGLNPPF
jgi:hypothetical protein